MTSIEKQQIMTSIGEKIRRARLNSDKTVKEIASHLKITTQAYGKMERGKCAICITRLIEVANFYHSSVLTFIPENCSMMLTNEFEE